ncbi:MAG: hypothetical protein JO295_05230 [Verrucomicrobia bacterium]|nr:hypothetical protein [Verrucomicrobiota bacterium]
MKQAVLNLVLLATGMLCIGGCATRNEFGRLYDYYFPRHSEYVTAEYRQYYDRWLFSKTPPDVPPTNSLRSLYPAFHGDATAAHTFFHHPDRATAGEFGEVWCYDCALLLIRFGDERFCALLEHEDGKTRTMVAGSALSQIDLKKHSFPKTQALLGY